MLTFDRFTLNNGLKVIVHHDKTTPLVAFNVLYDVGARDEDADKTGFAHLFEHLMFEGSKNIPNYDTPLQNAGGENNAFTNNDITNYYITIPADNLETVFWLESDRMLALSFSEEKLVIQKKVVIEEFKQRYLNQPYGDWNLLLRPLVYKKHPYQWPTIGKDISHIENASLSDVKDFFYKHYAPNNAVLVVAGNVETKQVQQLAEKWFGQIPKRMVPVRHLPSENQQSQPQYLEVERDVPVNAIFQAYKMCHRLSDDYYATDLISDILSNGKSTRLNQHLVKERKIFSKIDAYITGDIDAGMFLITGYLNEGIPLKQAQNEIQNELLKLQNERVNDYELSKVKNKVEANLAYSEINILTRAMNLAHFEVIKNADLINAESEKYQAVTPDKIQQVAKYLFHPNNSSTLLYHVKKQ